MKKLLLVVLAFAVALVAIGCQREKTVIDVNGSDTMVNMGAALAEEFMKANRNVEVVVSGGGSGTGIAALIDGKADIAQSSRDIRESERTKAQARGTLHEIIVAWDGLAIAVHPSNPVKELTMGQLAAIYKGEITNWKQVGGNDAAIVLLSRDTTSGTHVFFKEFVLDKAEFAPATMMMPSTEAIVQELAQNQNAIGYIGLGYVRPTVSILGIKADEASPAVVASIEAVLDRSYTLARPLFFYVIGDITGDLKKFIDFVVGADGQKIVRDLGFVPVN
ncbi:MAG: PstS family phosphate ABC transporter substrate-binding protein [Selenomonadales bacterium]|nr:PstS family phosphate ABC transporter substrate-binding protein [Selenomonadales bacterium]